jgi:hypothetical protein
MERRTYRVCWRNSIIHREYFYQSHFQPGRKAGIGKIETAGCEHGDDRETNGIIFKAQKINAPPLWNGL